MSVAPSSSPVTILGRGRVGRSLADAGAAAGFTVELRAARDDASFAAGFADDALVVLAVPDGAIAATAERVRATVSGDGGGPGDRAGGAGARPAVVHLSGASGFGPLESLRQAGFPVGVAHPFYPFPEVRPPAALRGVTFGVAATEPALRARLEALVVAIGGVPQTVDADGWVAYHAAGVMASNYLVVLAAQAAALLERAGFDRAAATTALLPLMRGTLDNLAAEGVDNALSGPLRRGDVGTVERHLDWLEDQEPAVAAVYRALAAPGVDLAVGTGLEEAAAEALRRAVG
jgi:predicted short-subunit dehydrogenase-like oxidoreductase (DUF2520 family)